MCKHKHAKYVIINHNIHSLFYIKTLQCFYHILYFNDVCNDAAANKRIPYLHGHRKSQIFISYIDIEKKNSIANKWF